MQSNQVVFLSAVVVFLSLAGAMADVAHHAAHSDVAVVAPVVPVEAHVAPAGVAGTAQKLTAPLTWDHKCFVCNTRNDAGCERPGEHHIKECNSSAVGCWKLYQQIEYDQEFDLKAQIRIVRQCAYIKPEGSKAKTPCVYRSGFGGMSTYCFCNHTTCNWGISTLAGANPIMTVIGLLFCLLVTKFAL